MPTLLPDQTNLRRVAFATILWFGMSVVAVPTAYAAPTPVPPSSSTNAARATSQSSDLDQILHRLERLLRRGRATGPAMTHGGATYAGRAAGLGKTRSGLPWHSGAWVGGRFTPAGIEAFGTMRGRKVDLVTTYGYTDSPSKLSGDKWPITTWEGFPGKLNYGLPLAFADGTGTDDVAAGAADQHFRQVARDLVEHGRGDSVVRAGWEFNYQAWPWGTNATNVDAFKKAFRRAATVMRAEAPQLQFEFGINCGDGLAGSGDRLAPLSMGYPGDDVVDIVGCDTYDRWSGHAADAASWRHVLRGERGPGIQDITDFARRHNKRAGFGEWGLSKNDGKNNGGGDNPFYINQMYEFFAENSDVVAFECYFDEGDESMTNSLVLKQMPRSRAAYATQWGRRGTGPDGTTRHKLDPPSR